MTVGGALQAAETALQQPLHAVAALDAEVLLAFVLGRDRIWLFTHGSDPIPPTAGRRFQTLIHQRSRGLPVAYLTGEKEFFGLTFSVTPATLIPRPETEQLVETALTSIPVRADLLVADIGTGSGCIAIALARHRPRLHIIAADHSRAALKVARRNARRHHVASQISFRQSDLLAAVPSTTRISLLIANLPYLKQTMNAWSLLRHEPRLALDGGVDGLAVYRRFFQQLLRRPNRPDRIICEIGPGLISGFRRFAKSAGYRITMERDLAQRPRVAILRA